MYRSLSRLTLSLLLLGLLSACGFHLRGQTVQLQQLASPLLVSGVTPDSALGHTLRQQLQQAGVRLTDTASEAGSVLRIERARSGERVLGLDARNRATEYELEESLRFSLRQRGGEATPAQTLRITRTLLAPQEQVLAGQQEARALREDMRRELVHLLIRRLAALL